MTVYVEPTAVPKSQVVLAAWGPLTLQMNRATASGAVFFAIDDAHVGLWSPGDVVRPGLWYKLVINDHGGLVSWSVDGLPQTSRLFCNAGRCKSVSPGFAFHAPVSLGDSMLVLPSGAGQNARERLTLNTSGETLPVSVFSSRTLKVWRQKANGLIYAAHSIELVRSRFSTGVALRVADRLSGVGQVVVFDSVSVPTTIDSAARVAWQRISPTSYRGTFVVHGTGVLVFGQSFSSGWRLSVSPSCVA